MNGGSATPATIADVGTFWTDIDTKRPLDVFFALGEYNDHATGPTIIKQEYEGKMAPAQLCLSALFCDNTNIYSADAIIQRVPVAGCYGAYVAVIVKKIS